MGLFLSNQIHSHIQIDLLLGNGFNWTKFLGGEFCLRLDRKSERISLTNLRFPLERAAPRSPQLRCAFGWCFASSPLRGLDPPGLGTFALRAGQPALRAPLALCVHFHLPAVATQVHLR